MISIATALAPFAAVVDRLIAYFVDAFAILPLSSRFEAAVVDAEQTVDRSKPFWAKLPDASVLVLPLPFKAADAFEAENTFMLQAHRIVPLPLEQVCWALGRAEDGAWTVGIVRRSDLAQHRSGSGLVGFRGGARQEFRFLDDAQRASRRRRWCLSVLAGTAAIAAMLLLFSEASARVERVLDDHQQIRAALIRDIRDAQGQLEMRASQQQVQGLTTGEMTQDFAALVEAVPAGWSVLSIRLEGSDWVLICEAQPDTAGDSGMLEARLAADDSFNAVRLSRIGRVGGLDRFEVRLTQEGAQ